MDLLEVNGLTIVRGTSEVLSNFDLKVCSGECVILSGPNGCGKSTLIEAVAGLLPVKKGSFNISKPFGLSLQNGGIHGDEFVQERIDIAAAISGTDVAGTWNLLERWNLGHRSADRIGQLSGGMNQRISVIQGLLPSYADLEPRICLLDEPSIGLDEDSVITLISDIQTLKKRGHSFLIATHDSRLKTCSDRIINFGEENSTTTQDSSILPTLKPKQPSNPFNQWVNKLHWRTKAPFVVLGLPLFAVMLILSAAENSSNHDLMLNGIILLSAPFLSAMTTPSALRYLSENRTGEWWRSQGNSFDPAFFAAFVIILSPFIISQFYSTIATTSELFCLGAIMYSIFHANQALHVLADRLPRSTGQFVSLLTLILIWPFILAAELVNNWDWYGFGLAVGIPIIIAVAIPIVHPRTGSN
ncbi:MAG: ATP-binding cassette domain-containing protein [Candidatus Thalassarchaeaceae archaeon]|nr:ATP-binding cassette domain-containing protein [Candidatus Thalassarchaeaceae archaeon]